MQYQSGFKDCANTFFVLNFRLVNGEQKIVSRPGSSFGCFVAFSDGEDHDFFDGTLGLGGHANLVLKNAPQLQTYVATDLDEQHLVFAREQLGNWTEKLDLHRANFSELGNLIPFAEDQTVSILLDLGLCSNQVDDPTKGFSFRQDGPLNMSFDTNSDRTAESLLASLSAPELTDVFQRYGEEPAAYKISRKNYRSPHSSATQNH